MANFDNIEQVFAAGEMHLVRAWIRESLERWFLKNDAISFKPFTHLFRSHMEPQDVIATVYRELGALVDVEANRTATGLFREALADLLIEPITFEESPFVYETLLKVGGLIKANEIAEAIAGLMRSNRLSAEFSYIDQNGDVTTYNFFRTAVYEMSRAGFESQAASHFFMLALENIEQDIDLFPLVFRQVLERLPHQRFEIARNSSDQMMNYLLGRTEYDDYGPACQELKAIFSVRGARKFETLSEKARWQFASSEAAFLIADEEIEHIRRQPSPDPINLIESPRDPSGPLPPQTVEDITTGQANSQNWSDFRKERSTRELRGGIGGN